MKAKRLRIVADANMPQVAAMFAPLGDVSLHAGRDITPAVLHAADVLLVRSVTRVDRALLTNSSVRFVGTATAGVDHIAADIRHSEHLGFSDAKGCNANSVVEYVLASFADVYSRFGIDALQTNIGIVGAGNVGSALAATLQALGATVFVYDPWTSCPYGTQVNELQQLSHCRAVSIHTPLITDGPYPTANMINAAFIDTLMPGTVLLAAGRGGVANEADVLRAIARKPLHYYSDVWHHEPVLNRPLVQAAAIATPHIAGYSVDGKVAATAHLYRQVCAYFGIKAPPPTLPFLEPTNLQAATACSDIAQFYALIKQAWPLAVDDQRLRAAIAADNSGVAFDALRAQSQGRLEFAHYCVSGLTEGAAALAASVGFTVVEPV